MAKQPWQKTKTKTQKDIKKEQERAKKRKEEKYEEEMKQEKRKRYKRVSILTLLLGCFGVLFQGSDFDKMTGGILPTLAAVCVMLSGVFCIAYGRLTDVSAKSYKILGGLLLGVAVVLGIMIFM